MKVLITGGGGFLGHSLAIKLLDLGYEVTILGRQSYPKFEKIFSCIKANVQDLTSIIKSLEGQEVVFSAIGDASPNNTTGFGQAFLAACAENRAFVRCVRNFLRINIVGKEELTNAKIASTNSASAENQTDPKYLLEQVMKEKKLSFVAVKKKLLKENYDGAGNIENISDIPKSKIFELIERIKKI